MPTKEVSKMFQLLAFLAMLMGGAVEQPAKHTLTQVSLRDTSVPGFSADGGGRCDDEKNLYLRLDSSGWDGPVLRLSRGDEPTLYTVPPSADPLLFSSYDVNSSGQIWLLNEFADGLYVLKFNKSGKLVSRIKLQSPPKLEARTFAVSNSGTIFN